MKTRESGMPDEEQWRSYFQPELVLDRLGLLAGIGHVVEFGCGYGTFTIPAARRARGTVYALDIDSQMIELVRDKAQNVALRNIECSLRDFATDGTGLPADHADFAMLFNILHAEHPDILLAEAWRVLKPSGLLGIMHWNYDPTTPRGPSMEIRPKPGQLLNWAVRSGFEPESSFLDLPPYHYGLLMRKPAKSEIP